VDLGRLGETGFLDELVRRHAGVMPPPPLGPGDDASVLGALLLTADALIEDEHFRSREPASLIGRKALSVNLSDIAAMGGTPRAFLSCIGLPPRTPSSFVRELTDGIAAVAAEHRVAWIGGDTVRSDLGIVIAITVVGERGRSLLLRSGARPGDGIYVTGPLGAPAAGRALLDRGWKPARRDATPPGRRRAAAAARRRNAELMRSQLDPAPRIAAGRFLASARLASAAIDLSDGLSLDLHRLCRASGAGAMIVAESIPISQATRSFARENRVDPLRLALDGGEDYELLFTVPSRAERRLSRWPLRDGTGPLLIGRVLPRAAGILIEDASGRRRSLRPAGYDAFRRRGSRATR
jgi:thiamine-monophosphate kinase